MYVGGINPAGRPLRAALIERHLERAHRAEAELIPPRQADDLHAHWQAGAPLDRLLAPAA